MSVKIGSFKGSPTISLDADSKYPFSFGAKKARLILQHVDAIKAFVAANPEQSRSNGNGHAPDIDQYADAQASFAARNGSAF
jgi:hypothetical protein